MSKNDKIITGVDIGTADVRAVIAKFNPDKGIKIIGVGSVQSSGVKKSEILSPVEIVPLVRIAVEKAEKDAEVETAEVYIAIGGGHINSSHASSVVNIVEGEETVNEDHLKELIEKAKENAEERGRSIIHCIPQEYKLDRQRGNQNPLGLRAARVEGAFHIISADKTILENHGRIINEGGFSVKGICFSVIATGNSVLDTDDKKDGVLIVDIGGGSTSYAIYYNNTVYYSNVFGVGGDHITNDLALGLQLNYNDAEELKSTYSLIHKMGSDNSDPNTITLKLQNNESKIIQREDVETIIAYRIDELLQFIIDDVEKQNYKTLLGNGVVFTGGTTKLFNFSKRAEKIFLMPVEIKAPKIFRSDDKFSSTDIYSDRHEVLRDTTYSTVLGLVRYACKLEKSKYDEEPGFWKRLFGN